MTKKISFIFNRLIKPLILPKSSAKKILRLGLLLIFVFYGLATPLHHAHAIAPVVIILGALLFSGLSAGAMFGKQFILLALGEVISGLLTVVLLLPLIISFAFLAITSVLLKWVTSPDFTTLSYTQPATNPIIAAGWPLMRDFANMGFVIALVFIGLGTALRIQEYQAKKALPRLVIMILLVNFTPVICGFFVDASNIIMNFFLQDGIDVGVLIKDYMSVGMATVKSIGQVVITDMPVELFAKTLSLLFFGIMAGFAFLAFTILFVMRYIAIWVLVILSPLAFVSRAFPAMKKFWNIWINQFIQWCIIGIPAAFFLYLTQNILVLSSTQRLTNFLVIPEGESIARFSELVNILMPYGVAIVFSWIGLFSSFSTSAMGASGVISLVQRTARSVQQKGVRTITQKPLGRAAEIAAAGLRKVEEGGKALEDRGKVGKLASLVGGMWAIRRGAGGLATGLSRYAEKAREAEISGIVGRKFIIPKNFDDMTPEEQVAFVNSLPDDKARAVAYARMAEKETLKRTDETFQKKAITEMEGLANNPRFKKEVNAVINAIPDKITKKLKVEYEISVKPENERETERDLLEGKKGKGGIRGGGIIDKIKTEFNLTGPNADNEAARIYHFQKINSGDIAKYSKVTVGSKEFRLATQSMGSTHFQKLSENFDTQTIDKIMDGDGGVNTMNNMEKLTSFYEKNPRLANWFMTSNLGKEWQWKPLKPSEFYAMDMAKIQSIAETGNENLRRNLRAHIGSIKDEIFTRHKYLSGLDPAHPSPTPAERAEATRISQMYEEIKNNPRFNP